MNAIKSALLGIMVVLLASTAWADIGFNSGATEEPKISKKDFEVTGVTRLPAPLVDDPNAPFGDRLEATAFVERIFPKKNDVPLAVFVEIECVDGAVVIAALNDLGGQATPDSCTLTPSGPPIDPPICRVVVVDDEDVNVIDALNPFLDLCLFGVIEGFAEGVLQVELELPDPPVLLNSTAQIAEDGAQFNTFRGLLIQP